jgi:hypothetical protein
VLAIVLPVRKYELTYGTYAIFYKFLKTILTTAMNLVSHLRQLDDKVKLLDRLALPLTQYPDISLQFYNIYTNACTSWHKGELTGVGDGFIGSGYLATIWCRWVGFRVTVTDYNNVPLDWRTKFQCGWGRSMGTPGESILHVTIVAEDNTKAAVELRPLDEYGPAEMIMKILNLYFDPA